MSDFLDYEGLKQYHRKAVKAFEFSLTIQPSDWDDKTAVIESNYIDSDEKYVYVVSYSSDKYAIRMSDVDVNGHAVFTCTEAPTENITVNLLRLEVHAHG